jgi:WD40 repeat protein
VGMSRDGRYVISGSADGTVRVWNFETKTQEKIIQAHSSAVLSLGLTKDNTRMVTSSGEWLTADSSTDCTVKVWSFYS